MKAAIIIPARLGSTRLEHKLLRVAAGKTIIQHTYERAKQSKLASRILIATDSNQIAKVAIDFGAETIMTSDAHTSGTSRVAEASRQVDADIIVNVQGDEPEINADHIDRLIGVQRSLMPFCSTLACTFPIGMNPKDPSKVKVVLGRRVDIDTYEAIYFTRARAPFPRDGGGEFYLHVGLYAFRRNALQAFAGAPESRLERIEKLEQLRILEMGERIFVALVGAAAPGVDTPEDFMAFLSRAELSAANQKK